MLRKSMTFAKLQQDYQTLSEQTAEEISTLQHELAQKGAECEHLKLVVKKLQHLCFGKKSERRIDDDPNQSLLFAPESIDEPNVDSREVEVERHSRKVRNNLSGEEEAPEGTFPEHLPRRETVIDEKPEGFSDEELEFIDKKVTERLGSVPEEHYVERIVRMVYKVKKTNKFHTPPAPEHVLDKRCKVAESFIVLMVIKKYLWALPLYRQQQQLKLQGIKLSRDSMVRWTIEFGGLLKVIADGVHLDVLGSEVVHYDETTVVVGKKLPGKKKSYETGYLCPILAEGIGVAFLYSPTRQHSHVVKGLEGFKKTLVSDAYDAYSNLVNKEQLSWQLCWMHIRRNFIEAEGSNPKLAGEALSFIRNLYAIERECRGLTPEKRAVERYLHSRPVLDEFKQWLNEKSASPEVITDKYLSTACSYVLKRWEAACLFIYDGNVPLDNGAAERALKPVKIGSKNWLHCASEVGAEVTATFYTLIASALMHGIHPYYYLLDLTKRINQPGLKAADLTPRRWKEKFFEEAVPEEFRTLLKTGTPFVGDPDKAIRQAAQKNT
jgi:transposase